MYVHVTCLNEWRAQSANPRSFYRCDQCHYDYNVQRTEWAAWLESERAVRWTTAGLLLLLTLLAAALLGPVGVAERFYRLVDFHPSSTRDAGRWIASHWTWWFNYLVSGMLGVASCGFAKSIYDAYLRDRHMQQTWVYGLVTAVCSNDERIFRVFALFGFIHASKVTLQYVEQLAKQQLTMWGTRIMEIPRG